MSVKVSFSITIATQWINKGKHQDVFRSEVRSVAFFFQWIDLQFDSQMSGCWQNSTPGCQGNFTALSDKVSTKISLAITDQILHLVAKLTSWDQLVAVNFPRPFSIASISTSHPAVIGSQKRPLSSWVRFYRPLKQRFPSTFWNTAENTLDKKIEERNCQLNSTKIQVPEKFALLLNNNSLPSTRNRPPTFRTSRTFAICEQTEHTTKQ